MVSGAARRYGHPGNRAVNCDKFRAGEQITGSLGIAQTKSPPGRFDGAIGARSITIGAPTSPQHEGFAGRVGADVVPLETLGP